MFDPTRCLVVPPRSRTTSGQLRKVGIEIEFAGISANAAALAIAQKFGGKIQEVSRHRHRVVGTRLGDFTAELDSRFAHPESEVP